MKVYRAMTKYELTEALKYNTFESYPKVFPDNNGWGKINNRFCYNTFTKEQNKNLHFFKYAIDAMNYLDSDLVGIRDARFLINYPSHYLCTFDIPDEILEKGYGFYPKRVSPEFIANSEVKPNYLINYTDSRAEMFKKILEELDSAIYWYSTTGKACKMVMDPSSCAERVCGTYTQGGFVRVFEYWLTTIVAKVLLTEEDTNKLMKYCNDKNIEAYNETFMLKDWDEMRGPLYKKYRSGLNHDEINEMFNEFEKIYTAKGIEPLHYIDYDANEKKLDIKQEQK